MLPRVLIGVGLLIAAFGALFILQGLGYVHWPASSFMLERREWADRGAATVVFGLLCVLLGRRLIRRQRQRERGALTGRARD